MSELKIISHATLIPFWSDRLSKYKMVANSFLKEAELYSVRTVVK